MNLSLCLIAKDENNYLKEWLDYHILLGVEHFWIYDNDSLIPLEDSIQDYIHAGWVTINKIHGKGMQLCAYDHCIQEYGKLSHWIGFIDTDEFIVPKTCSNLSEFLKEFEDFGGLAISSLFFGAGGHQTRPKCGQIAGYQVRTPEDLSSNRLVKSIVQPAKVLFPTSPHSFMYSNGNYCVNELSYRVDTQFFPCSVAKIQLNHYFTRSAQEWKEKINRGRGDMGDAYSDQRWKNADINSKIVDDIAFKLAMTFLSQQQTSSKDRKEFTNPKKLKFLELLSDSAKLILPPKCNAMTVDHIDFRNELTELINNLLTGIELIGSNKFLEARNLYTKMLQLYPSDLTQYTNLATACLHMQDFKTTWEVLAQAWRISPKDWTVLLCMVDYFYATENFEQVEKCSLLLQEYGNLEPVGVAVMALAQWKMGKQNEGMATARLLLPQLTPELIASHIWFQEMMDVIKPGD